MSYLLKNKVAIITGGSRGIGKAIAERFAKEGCNLMLASRTRSELEKTAQSIRKNFSVSIRTHKTDIGNESDVIDMVKQTITEFGKIDILVNNAAIIGPMGEISQIDGHEFFNTLKNNIGGTVFCTKAVIPSMKSKKYGNIINLSGGGGLGPLPYYDAYSTTKAAIVRLTENFALELKKYNINVGQAFAIIATNENSIHKRSNIDFDIYYHSQFPAFFEVSHGKSSADIKAPAVRTHIGKAPFFI